MKIALALLATAACAELALACSKRMYVHIISYGYTNYSAFDDANGGCWSFEAPKRDGSGYSVCGYADSPVPSGNAYWSYDDINIGESGHNDNAKVAACKAANSGWAGRAYVAPTSGGGWSHGSTAADVSVYFHECYSSGSTVNDRAAGCAANGEPMWNLGASTDPFGDTEALCASVAAEHYIGIFSPTGLYGKEVEIAKAMNACSD